MTEHFFERFLEPIIKSDVTVLIEYMMSVGLLKSQFNCPKCNERTILVKNKRYKDGKAFRCLNKTCHGYSTYYGIRVGTIFEYFNLSLNKCLLLMWKWVKEETQNLVKKDIAIGSKTLPNFYCALRKCCIKYFLQNPVRLGGSGIICQIDESNFRHKPKNHRGRASDNEIWIFGIADTSYKPAKVFLAKADNRSAAGLYDFIFRVCREGSIVWSDEWAAYNGLFLYGIEHETINHKLNFVDEVTGRNTQTIESYWNKLKLRVKAMKGLEGDKIEEYINEWMWKDMIYDNNWQNFLNLIKFYY